MEWDDGQFGYVVVSEFSPSTDAPLVAAVVGVADMLMPLVLPGIRIVQRSLRMRLPRTGEKSAWRITKTWLNTVSPGRDGQRDAAFADVLAGRADEATLSGTQPDRAGFAGDHH